MYELIQLTEKTFYLDCPAKIGLCLAGGTDVYLIDSGGDKDAGRKVRQLLDQRGWRLRAIFNTHSNADHIGGNRYLQQQTGCNVYAGGLEAAFTRYPVLEPSFLYGGFPCRDLRHKFLMAQESEVLDFSHESCPRELEVIPLPGHFFDMAGFRTPDDVVFLADCLCSGATLEKYGVTFLYDVAAQLETLDRVEAMEAAFFVPSHAPAAEDVGDLVRLNRSKIYEIGDRLADICREPASFEAILREIFRLYGLKMTFEQHVLVGSTVRSYLSWLRDSGRLEPLFEDNTLLWRTL